MNILDMSINASILIIAIVVIRALAIHRVPKQIFKLFWVVAIVRLLIPFSFSSGLSILQAAPINSTNIINQSVIEFSDRAISPLLLIWLCGMLVVASGFAFAYFRGYRTLSTSLPATQPYVNNWLKGHRLKRRLQVRISDQVTTPLAYGIVRPVIVLPKSMDYNDEKRLAYILEHEFVHIKCFDSILKVAIAFVLAIHWFNPLVWVLYILMNRDIELACDDMVIKELGTEQKAAYAHTLIDMAFPQKRSITVFNSFSKYAIEERIAAIAKAKTGFAVSTLIITIALLVSVVAFSVPAQQHDPATTPDPVVYAYGEDTPINDINEQGTADFPSASPAED